MNKKFEELNDKELENVSGGRMPLNHDLSALNTLNQSNNHEDAIERASQPISTGVTINQPRNLVAESAEKHIQELKQRGEEEAGQ